MRPAFFTRPVRIKPVYIGVFQFFVFLLLLNNTYFVYKNYHKAWEFSIFCALLVLMMALRNFRRSYRQSYPAIK